MIQLIHHFVNGKWEKVILPESLGCTSDFVRFLVIFIEFKFL